MADKFSKETRSFIMSRIRGRDTAPELALRKGLFRRGYRYKLGYRFKELNFKPDLVLVSKRTCIFVDGCFWHGCKRCFRAPKSNKMYWGPKIKRNMQRDKEQNKYLKTNGWDAIRVWEHEIKDNLERTVEDIIIRIEDSVPHPNTKNTLND